MSFTAPVTHVPGPWSAVVADGLALLVDADPAGPVVAACRAAALAGGGADGVLAALPDGTAFALAAAAGGRLRIAAGARGQAEFAGGVWPTIGAGGGRVDGYHDGAPTLRLSLADPAVPVPGWPLLPVDSGVVLAAALVVAEVRAADPAAAPVSDLEAARRPAAEPALAPPGAAPVPPGAAPVPPGAAPVPPGAAPVPPPDADPVPLPSPPGVPVPAAAPVPPSPPPGPDPVSQPEPPAVGVRPDATTGALGVPVLPWRALTTDDPPVPAGADALLLAVPPAPRDMPPAGDGAPMVQAVVCANNHLNAPFVVGACRVCGAPVPPQAPFLTPRPVLGVLVLGTGEAVPVDRDILLGRAPSPGAGEQSLSPRLVTLPSPQNDLSRTHVRVWIDGWLVQVADLGSTNGTVVTMPGQQPARLRPHEPFVLVPGTIVNLADEAVLRFEVPQ